MIQRRDRAAYAFVRGGYDKVSSVDELTPLRVVKFHMSENPIWFHEQIYLYVAIPDLLLLEARIAEGNYHEAADRYCNVMVDGKLTKCM